MRSSFMIVSCCVRPADPIIDSKVAIEAPRAVLLIGLAGAAHQAWSANLFTSASDIFPKRAVASVVGLGGMAGSLGGILFPLYSGKLLDRFQASGNVTAGYAILFGICGSAYLLAFLLNHALAPKFETIEFADV